MEDMPVTTGMSSSSTHSEGLPHRTTIATNNPHRGQSPNYAYYDILTGANVSLSTDGVTEPVIVHNGPATSMSKTMEHFGPEQCTEQGSIGYSPPQRFESLNLANCSWARSTKELKSLLGNSNARLKHHATLPTKPPRPSSEIGPNEYHRTLVQPEAISLEQAKSKVRVEVDINLESSIIIQGGYVRGSITVNVRKRPKKALEPILIAEGKLRLVGFESIPHSDDTYTFYQCAAPISKIVTESLTYSRLYDALDGDVKDEEGYSRAVEGVHNLPFVMAVPVHGSFGNAKGPLNIHSGVIVRYVAMVSIKVKDPNTGKRFISHFYRNCEVWPHLHMSILSPTPRPLQASTAKSLSVLPGSGTAEHKVKLFAQTHRLHWIAGQSCFVMILVHNDSKKTIKTLTLTLVRTTTVFKPRSSPDFGISGGMDYDASQISTSHKVVAESTLEMGQAGGKGYASAKGWWTGVGPDQEMEFSHSILLPTDALSMNRGKLLEVEYSIRVTASAGTLTSDVSVTLPLRIVNFISLDPPPQHALVNSRKLQRIQSTGTFNRKKLSFSSGPFFDGYVQGATRNDSDQHSELKGLPFRSDSEVSVCSSTTGIYSKQSSSQLDRSVGSVQVDEDRAEIEFVVGSAKLEQESQDGPPGRKEFSLNEGSFSQLFSKSSSDISTDTSDDTPRRMEGIGLTKLAQRVRDKPPVLANAPCDVSLELAPRPVFYLDPPPSQTSSAISFQSIPPSASTLMDSTSLNTNMLPVGRSFSTIRGPKPQGSRTLPRPPVHEPVCVPVSKEGLPVTSDSLLIALAKSDLHPPPFVAQVQPAAPSDPNPPLIQIPLPNPPSITEYKEDTSLKPYALPPTAKSSLPSVPSVGQITTSAEPEMDTSADTCPASVAPTKPGLSGLGLGNSHRVANRRISGCVTTNGVKNRIAAFEQKMRTPE